MIRKTINAPDTKNDIAVAAKSFQSLLNSLDIILTLFLLHAFNMQIYHKPIHFVHGLFSL
ncbi:hypothetical protein EOK76_g2799 [Lacticaseibacillus paracasei]|nr:hypothetical protein EOK76_g2799 [Lacticaseibacillus paracasei]